MEIKFACSCGQRIAVNSEGAGQQFPCPSCGLILTVPDAPTLTHPPIPPVVPPLPASEDSQSRRTKQPMTKKSARLGAEALRQRGKRKVPSLHQAAKKGTLHQIPKDLLTIEQFLTQNSQGETPLHIAARHGTLSQVPEEFLTPETLSVMESYRQNTPSFGSQVEHASSNTEPCPDTGITGYPDREPTSDLCRARSGQEQRHRADSKGHLNTRVDGAAECLW